MSTSATGNATASGTTPQLPPASDPQLENTAETRIQQATEAQLDILDVWLSARSERSLEQRVSDLESLLVDFIRNQANLSLALDQRITEAKNLAIARVVVVPYNPDLVNLNAVAANLTNFVPPPPPPPDSQAPVERDARRNPGPSGPGQASYLSDCGKVLAAPCRSGESPSLQEGVLQRPLPDPTSHGMNVSDAIAAIPLEPSQPQNGSENREVQGAASHRGKRRRNPDGEPRRSNKSERLQRNRSWSRGSTQ